MAKYTIKNGKENENSKTYTSKDGKYQITTSDINQQEQLKRQGYKEKGK